MTGVEDISRRARVSVEYICDMIRLNVIAPPDVGRQYSAGLTDQVVATLARRRAAIQAEIERGGPTVSTTPTRRY